MVERIILTQQQDPAFSGQLEQALLADLMAALPQAENSQIMVGAHNPDGRLVAGISGATSYGWLKIGLLWVDARYRRQGLGQGLVDEAFGVARLKGCHASWLETSNPSARDFYLALGFQPFGKLSNDSGHVVPKHQRWFLQREITGIAKTDIVSA